MKTTKNLAFALALSLGALATGCAAEVPANPDDPNDPSDPDDPPLPENVDATGKYQMKSSIDLAQNAPGKAGEIARSFIDATDDADDPTSWLLDQVINNIGNSTFKNILQGAKPFVAGYINDRLLEIAPDFVDTMLVVGNDFGEAAKSFGLNETLEVSGSAGSYSAKHSVTGARFKINNVESDYAFADFNATPVVVENVGLTVEAGSGKITLAQHSVGLKYGTILRVALDGAIIPAINPASQNLGQLFTNLVNCQAVGEQMHVATLDLVGFSPGAGVYRTACTLGLQKAADLIYSKLNEIDGSALDLGITGTAKALDKNNDNKIDTIQTGTWAGTMSYAGTPATLTGATFFAERM